MTILIEKTDDNSSLALLDLLARAQEELRLIRMKDCDAVYDTLLRTEIHIALGSAKAQAQQVTHD